LVWFILDVIFATTAVLSTYAPGQRHIIISQILGGFFVGVLGLYILSAIFPDDRQQITAYWTGILLELPVGWVSVYLLVKRRDTKGQSIEIW
jgi:Na+-driven multidrug efflux pump